MKCPNCGEEIDLIRRKCNACGSTFTETELVMIEERVEKTIRLVQSKDFGQELSHWIDAGDGHISNGDYTTAREFFEHAANEYPTSYRGFWGMVKTDTRMFTELPPAKYMTIRGNVNRAYNNMAHEIDAYSAIWDDFMKKHAGEAFSSLFKKEKPDEALSLINTMMQLENNEVKAELITGWSQAAGDYLAERLRKQASDAASFLETVRVYGALSEFCDENTKQKLESVLRQYALHSAAVLKNNHIPLKNVSETADDYALVIRTVPEDMRKYMTGELLVPIMKTLGSSLTDTKKDPSEDSSEKESTYDSVSTAKKIRDRAALTASIAAKFPEEFRDGIEKAGAMPVNDMIRENYTSIELPPPTLRLEEWDSDLGPAP